MGIFGRKKKDEEEEQEEKDSKPVKKSRTSKKKTPLRQGSEGARKPWTKRERHFVLWFLVATIVISGVLAMYARSWKLPNVPRLSIPKNTFEKTFVLEKNNNSKKHLKIISQFKDVTKSLSGIYGFKIINLITGESYGHLENEEFQAASLIKLPLMSMVFEESSFNRLSLKSIHNLKAEDKVSGSGDLEHEEDGTIYTIQELVKLLGEHSDNTAFNILVNKIGEDEFGEYINEIGMRNTSFEENTTTINDVAKYFQKLWELRLVDEVDRDLILEYLTNTEYESHLPSGIPDGIKVSHKYGIETHVVNDAGIIFADKPFVLVILTKGVVEKEADEVFGDLVQLLYDYEVNR